MLPEHAAPRAAELDPRPAPTPPNIAVSIYVSRPIYQDRTKRGKAETNDGSVFYSHIPSSSRPEIEPGTPYQDGPHTMPRQISASRRGCRHHAAPNQYDRSTLPIARRMLSWGTTGSINAKMRKHLSERWHMCKQRAGAGCGRAGRVRTGQPWLGHSSGAMCKQRARGRAGPGQTSPVAARSVRQAGHGGGATRSGKARVRGGSARGG